MFFSRSTQRSQPVRTPMIESMETRRLLSASHHGGHDDGPLHDRNDDHGVHVEKEHHARHGADDGAGHDANDDKGGKVKAAKSKSHGADDGANHDAKDDRGGHGKDDGAGHH